VSAQIQSIIKQLSGADASSREIDGAILWQVQRKRAEVIYWNAAMGLPHPLGDEMPAGLGRHAVNMNAPAYTLSVDAALDLIPENHEWLIGRGRTRPNEPLFGIQIFNPGSGRVLHMPPPLAEAEANTLAIAICLASLRARAAIAKAIGAP
jgi:hypothetical protein